MINVNDYPGGDNARAQAALADVIAQGGGCLHFSRGQTGGWYVLTEKLDTQGVPIRIEGEGHAATRIRWNCPDGGIKHHVPGTLADWHELEIVNCTLCTTRPGTENEPDSGPVLDAVWPEVEGQYARTLTMTDVVIRGNSFSDFWADGVKLKGARKAYLTRVHVVGKAGSPESVPAAVTITSEGSSCDVTFRDCHIQLAETGIHVKETSAYGPEAIKVDGCHMVSVGRGIVCQTGEPLLYVGSGTHIKAKQRCIETNMCRGFISDCHLALTDESEDGKGAVYLTGNRGDMIVHDCHLIGSGLDDNGIVVMGVDCCQLHDNNLYDWTTAIFLQTGTVRNNVHDNFCHACVSGVHDNDGGDYYHDNKRWST